MEKPFLKKSDKKKKINVKMPHVNRKPQREMDIYFKQKTRPRMNYKWMGKNTIQKIEKTEKNKVKLPHVNKKRLARKRIPVQTPFSHSTLNYSEKFQATKALHAVSLHFLFRGDLNHYSNLTSKIMRMCEQKKT